MPNANTNLKTRELRRENPTMGTAQAVRLARWHLADPIIPFGEWDDDWAHTLERDGFTVHVRAEYDYDSNPTDYLGTFTDDPEGAERNPEAWYLSTPYRDRIDGSNDTYMAQHRGQYGWVVLADGFDYASNYAWANRQGGMSRSVADEYARARVAESVRKLTNEYGYNAVYVTARVEREGVELGSAALYGIELTEKRDGSNPRWLSETAEELIAEAVADAREALARLCPVKVDAHA